MINCLLTGLARAIPGFTSPWPFHTAVASSGCMKDLGLVKSRYSPRTYFSFCQRSARSPIVVISLLGAKSRFAP